MQKDVIMKNNDSFYYLISESDYNRETEELLKVEQNIDDKYIKIKQDDGKYLYYRKEENNTDHLLYLLYNKSESEIFG